MCKIGHLSRSGTSDRIRYGESLNSFNMANMFGRLVAGSDLFLQSMHPARRLHTLRFSGSSREVMTITKVPSIRRKAWTKASSTEVPQHNNLKRQTYERDSY